MLTVIRTIVNKPMGSPLARSWVSKALHLLTGRWRSSTKSSIPISPISSPQPALPPDRTIVYVPELVAEATARLLVSYGLTSVRHEGIAYWAGIPFEGTWIVTTVLAPEADT